jgi:hypothetical protein
VTPEEEHRGDPDAAAVVNEICNHNGSVSGTGWRLADGIIRRAKDRVRAEERERAARLALDRSALLRDVMVGTADAKTLGELERARVELESLAERIREGTP